MDHKDTLNLPNTAFPMKASLAQREPERLNKWYSEDYYGQIRTQMSGEEKFIFTDGPPYANGPIHLGHALNKILKDIVVKSKTLSGFDVPYVPGWDCHGLPIEVNVEKKVGKAGTKLSHSEFRQQCREYAKSQIEIQKEGFIRLGVLGDWDNPYTTMAPEYEAGIMEAVGTILKNGHLKKGHKPVYWCFDCTSALAEAEVEYKDKTSHSIYVRFTLKEGLEQVATDKPINAIIWTTTPWTLPANKAIAFNRELEYAFVDLGSEVIIVAAELLEKVQEATGVSGKVISTALGSAFEGAHFAHPFFDVTVPGVLGEHVTLDAGTGLVHTAPAHGPEDFALGQAYNLECDSPLLSNGKFADDTPGVGGMFVRKAEEEVLEYLQTKGLLVSAGKLEHSYPMCWRHKTPVAYRATAQWFISMDAAGLIDKARSTVPNVKWVPDWGQKRIDSMLTDRPDWCISRQRTWGVPLPLVMHKQTGHLHPKMDEIINFVVSKAQTEGLEAWHNFELKDVIDDAKDYEKSSDTLDVWFDSGVTHFCVLDKRSEFHSPNDLVLEGSDQHRGWFQSSLLTSIAMKDEAPFKAVLTHGFVVDEKGYKMSKSLGNVVDPSKVTKDLGADILRLWVAAADYRYDMAVSDQILKRMTESYRRIRNTARFMLSNLYDFDLDNLVAPNEMVELDRWIVHKTAQLQSEIIQAYDDYQFHLIYQKIQNFCVNELGGFYLDILKDRLYTVKADAKARRSSQSALYYVVNAMAKWLAPIIPFTAEEIYEHIPSSKGLVFTGGWTKLPELSAPEFEPLISLRDAVNKAIETARSTGTVGGSLEAEATLYLDDTLAKSVQRLGEEARFVFLTSELTVSSADKAPAGLVPVEGVLVEIKKSSFNKCNRCWHRREEVTEDGICSRCETNLAEGEERCFV